MPGYTHKQRQRSRLTTADWMTSICTVCINVCHNQSVSISQLLLDESTAASTAGQGFTQRIHRVNRFVCVVDLRPAEVDLKELLLMMPSTFIQAH